MQRTNRFVLLAFLLALGLTSSASARGFSFKKMFRMSRGQEQSIAKEMNKELEQDPGFITEGEYFDLVQGIGKHLVEGNGLDEYDYQFFVVRQDEVNAFAAPAGYIYVTKGLLDYMAYDESMLAGVMAHELGHSKDRHVAKGFEKALQGILGIGILGLILGNENSDITDALAQFGGVVYLKYNRDQEEWADRYGVDLAYGAGYDAFGMVRGLECLEALYGSVDDIGEWMTNHPATDDRVERTTRIAMDTSGKEHGYLPIPCPPKDHPLYEQYKGRCNKPLPTPVIKRTAPVTRGKTTSPVGGKTTSPVK